MKIQSDRVLRNTPLGILIGGLISTALFAALDHTLHEELKKFYTFILAAFVTLIASTFALVGVFASIDNQQNINERTRRNKLEAARAFLPSALSDICHLAKEGVLFSEQFAEFRERMGADEFRRHSIDALSLSNSTISVLREMIELSDDDKVARRVAGLLREYQIFSARWRSEFDRGRHRRIATDGDVRHRTVSWAYLYAIAASLFDYARNESKSVDTDVGEAEISTALNISGIEREALDFQGDIGLYARAFRRRFS